MVTRVYRRVPVNVSGGSGNISLGYLDFDRSTRCVVRYTPEGTRIDMNGPWSNDFDAWAQDYADLWTFDPSQAYFSVDPDMTMDEGL